MKGQTPLNVSAANECVLGSKIPWIYVEVNFSKEAITTTTIVHWLIARKPADNAIMVADVYYDPDKRFIIKRGMEMLPKDVNHVVKRIIPVKVPKGMQRIGRDDNWVFKYVSSNTNTLNTCGFAIIKPQT